VSDGDTPEATPPTESAAAGEPTVPAGAPVTVSVIVVNLRARDLLLDCLAHIEAAARSLHHELIVVENESDGETAALVRERHPEAIVIEERTNTGFAPAVAKAIAHSSGEWVALVNNDANLDPAALGALLAAGTQDPRIGSVAARILFSEQRDTVNSAGIVVDGLGVAFERLAGAPAATAVDASREVFGATGCVALYRRAMLDAVGGFDASFFAYLEDVDVAWRARAAGWRAVYEPAALAHHRGSASSKEGSAFKYRLVGRNRMRLLAKNATTAQLLRYGPLIVLFDLAYIAFAGLTGRTLAPLTGRLAGLREWRHYRAQGAPTRGVTPLAPVSAGWRGALAQYRGYRRGGAARASS
jgi:GT2 family glycosyltransferase